MIRRTKAAAEGEVVQSAYNLIDEDHVDVLAFVRQRARPTSTTRTVCIAEQWASLSMVRDGDDWLIDKVDIVSVPPPS